jgi:hypothetical protein
MELVKHNQKNDSSQNIGSDSALLRAQDSMVHLQLVNALSTNQPLAILEAIGKLSLNNYHPTYGSPLHLVTSLCIKDVVDKVVEGFCKQTAQAQHTTLNWINSQNVIIFNNCRFLMGKLRCSTTYYLNIVLPQSWDEQMFLNPCLLLTVWMIL